MISLALLNISCSVSYVPLSLPSCLGIELKKMLGLTRTLGVALPCPWRLSQRWAEEAPTLLLVLGLACRDIGSAGVAERRIQEDLEIGRAQYSLLANCAGWSCGLCRSVEVSVR